MGYLLQAARSIHSSIPSQLQLDLPSRLVVKDLVLSVESSFVQLLDYIAPPIASSDYLSEAEDQEAKKED